MVLLDASPAPWLHTLFGLYLLQVSSSWTQLATSCYSPPSVYCIIHSSLQSGSSLVTYCTARPVTHTKKMAYQTYWPSTRPGPNPPAEECRQSHEIVFLPRQQPNANGNTQKATTGVASYVMTTNVNHEYTSSNQHQTPQPTQEKLLIAAPAANLAQLDLDAGYKEWGKTRGDDPARQKGMNKRHKVASFKVSNKQKKMKLNATLRHIIKPMKSADTVLYELYNQSSVKYTFHKHTKLPDFYTADVEVDCQTYSGQGFSKIVAKQNAAEIALKALLLEKIAHEDAQQQGKVMGDVTMKVEEPDSADIPPSGEELDEKGQQEEDDDVPWGSLASFAIFKLFQDWQIQGLQPTEWPAAAAAAAAANPPEMSRCHRAPMKRLPDNPTNCHPVSLLYEMRPSLIFHDISVKGARPNVVFTRVVTVDGVAYQGKGRNKKEAKKEAAKSALAAIFNIHYDN